MIITPIRLPMPLTRSRETAWHRRERSQRSPSDTADVAALIAYVTAQGGISALRAFASAAGDRPS